jgi:L-alanine-DL-glutamate epimerase-like enolase superfamily enzyme
MLSVAALCDAHGLDLSAHCVPNLSAHVLCGARRLRHLEYFHDHVRIEQLLFDGTLDPSEGSLCPDRTRPGLGLTLKEKDAEQYRVR